MNQKCTTDHSQRKYLVLDAATATAGRVVSGVYNLAIPIKTIVVTHIACARVDIFDHYEITVS
jgi:hypothetical protein